MTDEELRSLVRAAVARHLAASAAGAGPSSAEGPENHPGAESPGLQRLSAHPGFYRYALSRGDDDDACLIEPQVRCTHCGFCQSHGF
jgi:hypothetical protein